MARGYSIERYLRIVNSIRKKMPDAAISSDVIVGFPGETDIHFDFQLKLTLYFKMYLAGMYSYEFVLSL